MAKGRPNSQQPREIQVDISGEIEESLLARVELITQLDQRIAELSASEVVKSLQEATLKRQLTLAELNGMLELLLRERGFDLSAAAYIPRKIGQGKVIFSLVDGD